jgi:hypothetical protein
MTESRRGPAAMAGPLDFATAGSLAPLIYEIRPAGPGKLFNQLHTAEALQLVGAHVF